MHRHATIQQEGFGVPRRSWNRNPGEAALRGPRHELVRHRVRVARGWESTRLHGEHHVFGPDAVQVLPLEFISQQGVKAYLDHLSRISGFEFSSAEIRGYVARNASPPHDIVLDNRQRAVIRRRSSAGNALVAKLFNLPLRDLGYPFPD